MRRFCRLAGLAAGAAVLAGAGGAPAAEQMLGSAAEGGKLAREVCVQCHEVEPGGVVSPNPEAKPFQEIAADPKMTALALRVFLRSPHIEMPNFVLTDDQIDNITAYIHGLR